MFRLDLLLKLLAHLSVHSVRSIDWTLPFCWLCNHIYYLQYVFILYVFLWSSPQRAMGRQQFMIAVLPKHLLIFLTHLPALFTTVAIVRESVFNPFCDFFEHHLTIFPAVQRHLYHGHVGEWWSSVSSAFLTYLFIQNREIIWLSN